MASFKRYLSGDPAPLSTVAVLLLLGIGCLGFGNADRLLQAAMARGGTSPGIVLDVRSYTPAGASQLAYVPKVAFRDDAGQVRIREAYGSPLPFEIATDQPVRVLWDEVRDEIAVDLVRQRGLVTGLAMSGVTALGVLAWLCAIWLLARRVWLGLRAPLHSTGP